MFIYNGNNDVFFFFAVRLQRLPRYGKRVKEIACCWEIAVAENLRFFRVRLCFTLIYISFSSSQLSTSSVVLSGILGRKGVSSLSVIVPSRERVLLYVFRLHLRETPTEKVHYCTRCRLAAESTPYSPSCRQTETA